MTIMVWSLAAALVLLAAPTASDLPSVDVFVPGVDGSSYNSHCGRHSERALKQSTHLSFRLDFFNS